MDFDINDLNFISHAFNLFSLVESLFIISFSFLIFYIIITKCNYKLPEIMLMLVMNIIHVICGTSGLVFAILKIIFGHQYLRGKSVQCVLNLFAIVSLIRFELFTVAFLAFVRYAIACHNIKKSTKFWVMFYLIAMVPIVSMYLYALITIDANPSASMLLCIPYLNSSRSNFILSNMNLFIFIIPCWVSTYCYFAIGIKSYKMLNQIKSEAIASNDNGLVGRIRKQKLSLIFQLSIVFIIFNFSYMPTYLTLILNYTIGYRRPPFFDALVIEIIETSRAIDPIITIVFQPELNHEFKVFITKFKAKFKAKFKKIIESLFRIS